MAHLIFIVAGFLLSALMGRLIIPRILVISLRKRLFDIPDFRKIHQHPISRLGGVTFFPVIMLVMCAITLIGLHIKGFSDQFFSNHIVDEMLCLTAGLVLLYIIGVCDDLIGVRYGRKLLVQVFAASFLPFAGLYVVDFYGLFGVDVVSPFIGIPLTILLTVFVTNAINLIDGIDGLASGLCMIALLIFGTAFALNGVWMYSLLAFVCLGVLIPFFLYNVFGNAEHGSKIFMGDTGSLTLGFILSLFSVKYILLLSTDSSAVSGTPIVWVFSLLLVPCLDVCRVVLNRLQRKANPFKPDKTHIHHKFLMMGFSPRRSLVLIQLISL
ncbi:MAG: undecaprenyl/decaprenyl-phosphate alpha-N-acetylglucosaminyl 1-phosphate transferase, partial [Bacteroidaceae bacterium]|nr:undecaprenyl/decaprenyl-phosphate alpha-N-acetylglucosaminyl 1-phosphate transferase [Bacteroidaceae bacterium]